ncbi:MAG: hypothetical protein CVU40_17105 [Chloroflexi bacterium HGW-Chloroflexi-2]|jgi:hypothetical protein|nr:MAG: hypothetical protein CVU40_17105 [Chloroflexi bacterium HGW-Chloroflexi-2]
MAKRSILEVGRDWLVKQLKLDTVYIEPDLGAAVNERDRADYDREYVISQALEAWRLNPLARRIVELTSQYVVGGGISIGSPDEKVNQFLKKWWAHELNQMPLRIYEWCDELTRSGELFFLLSTDAAGMTFVRAIPAIEIKEIRTAKGDLQQELEYVQKAKFSMDGDGSEERAWKAYHGEAEEAGEDGRLKTVMVHFAINRPVGAVHGESDLAPILRWLTRYASWLEDRARLNRYRNAFYFMVKSRFVSEAERVKRQSTLNANPPLPGSILVVDESESWEVIHPQLEANDASKDGLAIKKMIAAGTGIPLHFLAEPESATRTTAESAGGPTFRHFEQRQEFFIEIINRLARIAVMRRARYERGLDGEALIEVVGADLSSRDNAALAIATSTITSALVNLFDRGLIDGSELVRMVYRFAGEVVDIDEVIRKAKVNPPKKVETRGRKKGIPNQKGAKVDMETGDLKGSVVA